MMFDVVHRLFLLLLVLFGYLSRNAQARLDEKEIAAVYEHALLQYDVFPALDPDPSIWLGESNTTIRPVEAVIAVIVRSIDSISPGSSEFAATTSSSIYWSKNDCNQTMTHKLACSKRLNRGEGLRFVRQENAVGGALETTLQLFYPNAHQTVFEQLGLTDIQPNAEVIVATNTYKNSFDVRHFPYEVHALDLKFTSIYSSNVVRLSSFPNYDNGLVAPRVPAGWEYLGVDCRTFIDDTSRTISVLYESADEYDKERGGIQFYTYQCTIFVARKNAGWWMTSFFLFCALLVIAYAGSAGVISHMVAEKRDDIDGARQALFDGTRMIGTFTIGLLLVYVFQVDMSPYGRPIEAWPTIPASTMIYMLGLITIVVLSMSGLIGSLIFSHPFHYDGFVGGFLGPYDIAKCPIEGKAGEDRSPLLLKKRQYSEPDTDGDSDEDPALDNEQTKTAGESVDPVPLPATRRCNGKTYNVLSVEEAVQINIFVRNIFFLKTGLLIGSFVAAAAILVAARNNYNDMVEAALEATHL